MLQLFTKNYKVRPDCQISNLNHIYKNIFGYKRDGSFVEVGAYDGERWSNTSFLADIGWNGIYIEPVNEFFLKCKTRHIKNGNTRVLNFAIGEEEKEVEIFVAQGLSTILKNQKEFYEKSEFSKHVKFSSTEMCTQKRLDTVLNDNHINPGFDLLVVDTEGYEIQVFNSFDLNFWRPRLLIVELHDKNEHFADFKEFVEESKNLRKKILENSYEIVYEDEINTVFKSLI